MLIDRAGGASNYFTEAAWGHLDHQVVASWE
jgi:hypothetical protein